MSPQSRNRGVGERLGRGETLADILRGMEQVAEGVWTSGTAWPSPANSAWRCPSWSRWMPSCTTASGPRRLWWTVSRDPRAERD